MSKRLQVVVPDQDLVAYERTARVCGLTLSEWVRQTLREAQREVSTGDVEAKLAAISKAAQHDFPAPDIDTMVEEIEAGYRQDLGD